MIKVAAAFLLLLGSGLIFRALVAMDAPNLRPRILARRYMRDATSDRDTAPPLRRAA